MTEQQLSSRGEPTPDRPYTSPDYGFPTAPPDTEKYPWRLVNEELAKARNYWVSSTRPDGRPHAMPVWGVWLNETLYFSSGRGSVKGRNLAANPQVIVHLESGDNCVILEGAVVEAELEQLAPYIDAYEAKYNFRPDPTNAANANYFLRPQKVLTWQEADFVESATRWQFEAE